MDELISFRDFEENRHSLAEIQRRETLKVKIKPNYINSVWLVLVCQSTPHHIPEKSSVRFVFCKTNIFYCLSDPDTIPMRVTKEGRYQATDALKSLLLAKYQQYKKRIRRSAEVSSVAYLEYGRQNSRPQNYDPDPRIFRDFITPFNSTLVLYVCMYLTVS